MYVFLRKHLPLTTFPCTKYISFSWRLEYKQAWKNFHYSFYVNGYNKADIEFKYKT